LDANEARSTAMVDKKFAEIEELRKQAEEGNSELEEALKNRINLNFDEGQDA